VDHMELRDFQYIKMHDLDQLRQLRQLIIYKTKDPQLFEKKSGIFSILIYSLWINRRI
jgi:hypothetical protein